MDLRWLAPYIKLILFAVEFYFLYMSFDLVFYSPQTTYIVLRGTTDGVTDFRTCLHGEPGVCLANVNSAEVKKCLLEFINSDQPTDHMITDNTIDHDKPKEKPVQQDKTKPQGGGRERVKRGAQRDHRDSSKKFSKDFLRESLDALTEIMNELVENDPNSKRSLKARQGVIDAVSSYEKLLAQTKDKEDVYGPLISKLWRGLQEEKEEL